MASVHSQQTNLASIPAPPHLFPVGLSGQPGLRGDETREQMEPRGWSPGVTDAGRPAWDCLYRHYHDLLSQVLTSFIIQNGLSKVDKVISYFKKMYLFVCLFLAALGLHGCMRHLQPRLNGCPDTGGIFLDQAWNQCPLHRQADSLPLDHRGSPISYF